MLGAAPVEVGADREHHDQSLVGVGGALDQRVEEGLALGLVATGDEDLLELIDEEDQTLARPAADRPRRRSTAATFSCPDLGHRAGEGSRELGERALARSHHRPAPAVRAGDDPVGERGQETGAYRRGLAAAGGAEHRQQGRADEPGDELGDEALAAEEVLGVRGVEGARPRKGQTRGSEGSGGSSTA